MYCYNIYAHIKIYIDKSASKYYFSEIIWDPIPVKRYQNSPGYVPESSLLKKMNKNE